MNETAPKNLITITYPNDNISVLDAEKGHWTDYRYDGTAFIVLSGKMIVGIYNFQHVKSIEIKPGEKEAAPNV